MESHFFGKFSRKLTKVNIYQMLFKGENERISLDKSDDQIS